jgi:hypothetical protein
MTEGEGSIWGKAENSDTSVRLASSHGWSARLAFAKEEQWRRLPGDLVFLFLVFAFFFSYRPHTSSLMAERSTENRVRREARKKEKPESARKKAASTFSETTGVCGRATLLRHADLLRTLGQEKFFTNLEEFYTQCAAVVSRYHGRMHAVHGHELLFFFPEGGEAQGRLGLSAARDLVALAESRGFGLAVALAYGQLYGSQLQQGFALFGEPVEEAGDFLEVMAGQKESAVWVSPEVARLAGSHAKFLGEGRKGRRAQAMVLAKLGDVRAAIEGCKKGEFSELSFHRGDSALGEVLRSLAAEQWQRETYVEVVNELRRVQCRRCGPEVADAYRQLLSCELEKKDSYRLSSVLALAPQLLSRSTVDRNLERLFLQAVTLKDRRVRANAVELFTRFFPEREIPELRSLVRDEDNRVSANALIKAACERFDEKVIARIEERVMGGSVAHVASALHAMGEIALYYRRHDPLFLGTKIAFLRLFENVPMWAAHPNPMIRRQALIAAHKLASESVDERLRTLFQRSGDAELLELFKSVYGWKRDQQAAA